MRRAPLGLTLIPAPLDLSLPLVDEKAALPAIIVTPSSPSSETDFSIAFPPPPPKPTLAERFLPLVPALPPLSSYLPSQIQLPPSPFKTQFDENSMPFYSLKTRARTMILLMLLLFIMASHLVIHRLASSHPRLEFGVVPNGDIDLVSLANVGDVDIFDTKRNTDFVVWEAEPATP
ncbi:hypothetical protein A0H81_03683 [Grifola frondosa]|uniref:Uncharacterized protein n=1 Tax=Grifola frondosa TaxID=5627 RepID=A0A1C7MHM7_GRIFR|nr:hypothetical protein A0H81_03683 [Grifola frondosa]